MEIFLTISTICFATLAIVSRYRGPAWLHYITKPLTMMAIIVLAVFASPSWTLYSLLILLGLSAALIGDVFLMLPTDRFIQGLASFLVAHLLYIAAFAQGHLFFAHPILLIALAIYGLFILTFLWKTLGPLKAPVIIYMLAILTMTWQASSRFLEFPTSNTSLALAGALLFMASDSILALDRFRKPFKSAQFWILSTYFAAQWCIATSLL